MKAIKSKLSKNYYTNFRVNNGVVVYELIDARRGQRSRTYIYTEGNDFIVSIHTNKYEREILTKHLQGDLLIYINKLIQCEKDRKAYNKYFQANEKGKKMTDYNYATLMFINLAIFLLFFVFGVVNINDGEALKDVTEGCISLLASVFPVLSAVLLTYHKGTFND